MYPDKSMTCILTGKEAEELLQKLYNLGSLTFDERVVMSRITVAT